MGGGGVGGGVGGGRAIGVRMRAPSRPRAHTPSRPHTPTPSRPHRAHTPSRPHAPTPPRPHAHTPTRPHAHTPSHPPHTPAKTRLRCTVLGPVLMTRSTTGTPSIATTSPACGGTRSKSEPRCSTSCSLHIPSADDSGKRPWSMVEPPDLMANAAATCTRECAQAICPTSHRTDVTAARDDGLSDGSSQQATTMQPRRRCIFQKHIEAMFQERR